MERIKLRSVGGSHRDVSDDSYENYAFKFSYHSLSHSNHPLMEEWPVRTVIIGSCFVNVLYDW